MGSFTVTVVLVAVLLLLVLGATGLWWIQSSAAVSGRRANPDNTERDERLAELGNNQRAAERVIRVVAPAAAIAVVLAIVLAVVG